MKEIHEKDVMILMEENRTLIEENRSKYEKYKVMTDLIREIQKQREDEDEDEEDDSEEANELETTTVAEMEDFEEWVKTQTKKDISNLKDMTDIPDPTFLRQNISSLNSQQRRIFDDFSERVVSDDCEEPPFYLFISGSAGTGTF